MAAPGDAIIVALSGGADSVCLLSLMKKLGDDIGVGISAIHINHMLRGSDSDADEEFCRSLCEAMKVPLITYRRDVSAYAFEHGMTLEEAGRTVRYELFNKAKADKVAIAHNMDDNAETFIINLVRGAGSAGLSGISDNTGKYIRPLMIFRKREILNYCKDEGIAFRTDSSNDDTVYFRNSVRHRLIPMIDEITGRDTVPIINRTAGMIASDEDFINIECEKAFKDCVKTDDSSASINNAAFNMLHEAIASRILRKAYASVEGSLKDFEKKNTDILMNMIRKGKTGDSIDLSSGTYAIVQFGTTIIRGREEAEDYEYILEVPGSIYIRERDITINSTFGHEFNGRCEKEFICIESENAGPLTVRNRRDGDRFTPAKGNGTKKLKKYFIDHKIDRMERNKVFLLIFSGKIAYIEGMEHGKGFVPSEGCGFVRIGIERGKNDV